MCCLGYLINLRVYAILFHLRSIDSNKHVQLNCPEVRLNIEAGLSLWKIQISEVTGSYPYFYKFIKVIFSCNRCFKLQSNYAKQLIISRKIDYLINIFLRMMISFSPSAIIFFLTDLCCTHIATLVSGICINPLWPVFLLQI